MTRVALPGKTLTAGARRVLGRPGAPDITSGPGNRELGLHRLIVNPTPLIMDIENVRVNPCNP